MIWFAIALIVGLIGFFGWLGVLVFLDYHSFSRRENRLYRAGSVWFIHVGFH